MLCTEVFNRHLSLPPPCLFLLFLFPLLSLSPFPSTTPHIFPLPSPPFSFAVPTFSALSLLPFLLSRSLHTIPICAPTAIRPAAARSPLSSGLLSHPLVPPASPLLPPLSLCLPLLSPSLCLFFSTLSPSPSRPRLFLGPDVIRQPRAAGPVACQGAGVPPLSDVFVNNIFALTQKLAFWRWLVGDFFFFFERPGAEGGHAFGNSCRVCAKRTATVVVLSEKRWNNCSSPPAPGPSEGRLEVRPEALAQRWATGAALP